MKKQKLLNAIMVVLILAIVASGILLVGSLKGWFANGEDAVAGVEQVAGIVNIRRGGIVYRLEKDMELLPGDGVETASKAWVRFDGTTLLENSRILFREDGSAQLQTGAIFSRQKALSVMDGDVYAEDAVFYADALTGSANILVLSGKVEYTRNGETQSATAGQQINILEGECSVAPLPATALKDDAIRLAKEAAESLCFPPEELEQVITDREAERLQAAGVQTVIPANPKPDEIKPADPKPGGTTSAETRPGGTTTQKPATEKPAVEQPAATEPVATQPAQPVQPTEEPTPKPTEPVVTQPALTCTIQIRCDTILNNWDNLEPGKSGFVPSNGCILATTKVEFTEGETVFDVLKRVCNYYGIQLEYSWTPMYGSYYIEGINHLYEFDCGSQSGWMYKVNGWFPNYGCSSYTLSDADVIVWCYTCNGLGADVGCSWMG